MRHKQFCSRGHDTSLPNALDTQNRCRECKRKNQRDFKAKRARPRSANVCRNGHDRTVEGVDKQGGCLKCRRASSQAYIERLKTTGKWETREASQRASQDRRKADGRSSRSSRDSRIKRVFGLSSADYDRMFLAQGGVCAICRQPETAIRLGKGFFLSSTTGT